MTQQHGRRFEHDLTTELAAATTDDVWVRCVGYSGNSAVGGSDLVVTVNPAATSRGGVSSFGTDASDGTDATDDSCGIVTNVRF